MLWGWYVPPPEGKVVILRHGSGSTASAVVPHARMLVDHGYGVLLADARGHGQSEGTAMDFGWHGDADTAAAVDFLVGQPEVDVDRIAVLGMSMGGEEAIGAAGSDERIAAVVAEGATARTDRDKTWLIDAYGWRGRVQVGLEWLQYGFTELLSGSERPISLAEAAADASPRPILMITGGAVPDEGQAAAHVRETAGDNVSVWTVPGAGHIQGLAVSPEEWEQMVVGFLDQALTATPR
jgi:pimeloyl-ACP methyl ester carboxylesterase